MLAGGLAAVKFSQGKVDFVVDFAVAKFSLSLVRLSSSGYNFFFLALIHTPFEELDS